MILLMTESAQLQSLMEAVTDQKLIRTVLARKDERSQAIEVDIGTMSVIGLAGAVEESRANHG